MFFSKFMDKIKSNKFVKKLLITLVIGGSVAGGVGVSQKPEKPVKNVQIKPKVALVKNTLVKNKNDTVKNPVLEIKFRTDTLEKPRGSTLLYYLAGEITRYFVADNDSYRLQLSYICHEKWHDHNADLKMNIHYLTPLECYKLKMHDEISANICEVLMVRYEYLFAKDKKAVLDKYKNHLSFYVDAVRSGKIHPEDNSQEARETEWKFIANGTQNMWMKKFSKQYGKTTYSKLCNYLQWMGLSHSKNRNYEILTKGMYTIGGVNFFKYMDHDIDVHDDVVTLKDNIKQIRSFSDSKGRVLIDHVNTDYELLSKVPQDRQFEAIQHLLLAARLKYMLRDIAVEEIREKPNTIARCYENIWKNVSTDYTFADFVQKYALIGYNIDNFTVYQDFDYKKNITKMYEYKGIDLTSLINGFSVDDVPIPSYNYFSIGGSKQMHAVTNFNSVISPSFEDKDLHSLSHLSIDNELEEMRENSKKKKAEPQDITSKEIDRYSDILYLRIPNFYEPILVNSTEVQVNEIRRMFEEFTAIPEEFIHCFVKPQEKYMKKHPGYKEPYRYSWYKDKKDENKR